MEVIYKNKKEYIGGSKNGLAHGEGIYRGNNVYYTGEFKEGTFCGEGYYQLISSINGAQILKIGTFKNFKLVAGTLSHNGDIYNGIFNEKEELISGQKIILNSEFIYNGTYSEGQLINGMLTSNKGYMFIGKFDNEILVKGKKIFPNEINLEGTFENNYLVEGLVEFPNGDYIKGEFDIEYEKLLCTTEQMFFLKKGTKKINGTKLKGTFENNYLIEGYIEFPNGEYIDGKFDIEYEKLLNTTEQMFFLKKGQKKIREIKLEGTFEKDLLIKGKKTWNTTIFEGEFNSKEEIVKGKVENGNFSFIGTFTRGKLDGKKCKLVSFNSYILTGTFKDGFLIEGKKEMIKEKDGAIFEGIFEDGYLIEGTAYFPRRKSIYSGTFKNKFLQQGKKEFSDGTYHIGEFKSSSLIKGKKLFKNGVIHDGTFKNEQIIQGKIILTNGTIHEGIFERGDLFEGTITHPDGTVEKYSLKKRKSEEKIKEKSKERKIDSYCNLCRISIKNMIFPCGHMYSCKECSLIFVACPVCKKPGIASEVKF